MNKQCPYYGRKTLEREGLVINAVNDVFQGEESSVLSFSKVLILPHSTAHYTNKYTF